MVLYLGYDHCRYPTPVALTGCFTRGWKRQLSLLSQSITSGTLGLLPDALATATV